MTKDNSKVLALFVADLHLSLTPPPYRSTEPDWFAAMARPLDELTQLQEKYSCPIFCAGDIFDRWNAPAELINWAMTHLPYVHCIPGQHDLPEHDMGQIERSAYWTLVKASVIRHLGSESTATFFNMDGIVVHSYPYGVKISPRHKLKSKWIQIALIHQYNWVPNAVYKQDAPKDQHVDSSRKEFEGYDLIVAGDNHIPFDVMMGETRFVNCGGFMIRKSDDCWQPRIWKLIADGRMEPHPLGTSKDKYLDTEDVKRMEEQPEDFDLSELFDSLGKLGTDLIDVRQAFLRAFRREPSRRTKMLLKAMEE